MFTYEFIKNLLKSKKIIGILLIPILIIVDIISLWIQIPLLIVSLIDYCANGKMFGSDEND